jgi:hypothetical protein
MVQYAVTKHSPLKKVAPVGTVVLVQVNYWNNKGDQPYVFTAFYRGWPEEYQGVIAYWRVKSLK